MPKQKVPYFALQKPKTIPFMRLLVKACWGKWGVWVANPCYGGMMKPKSSYCYGLRRQASELSIGGGGGGGRGAKRIVISRLLHMPGAEPCST